MNDYLLQRITAIIPQQLIPFVEISAVVEPSYLHNYLNIRGKIAILRFIQEQFDHHNDFRAILSTSRDYTLAVLRIWHHPTDDDYVRVWLKEERPY